MAVPLSRIDAKAEGSKYAGFVDIHTDPVSF